MVFQLSKMIVSELEREVINDIPTFFRLFDGLKREVVYPLKLLAKGFDIWLRDFFKFSILSLVAITFIPWAFSELSKSEAVLNDLIFFALILIPMIVSMFSSPSSYSFCGVGDKNLAVVFNVLKKYLVSKPAQIELVRQNIEIYEKRVRVRIIGLRAFMALCWSGWVYICSGYVKLVIERDSGITITDIFLIAASCVGILMLYAAIESYSKINTLIFRSAILGCNEYEYVIISEIPEPSMRESEINSSFNAS